MTLKRTTRRRQLRKRAKARKAEARRQWDALSPERRARVEAMNRMLADLILPTLMNNLRMVELVNREYDEKCAQSGVAIMMRLPRRYDD